MILVIILEKMHLIYDMIISAKNFLRADILSYLFDPHEKMCSA